MARLTADLESVEVQGVPVHRPATILVHLVSHPTDVRSWSGILERLEDLVRAACEGEVREEVLGRPKATHVRLAYLLCGVAPDLVERLNVEPVGNVWFRPRRKVRRYDSNWNVADTVLPVSPSELASA